jgi:hypothetical protein
MATCPVCGGEVALTLGAVFSRCGYCRASVVVEGDAVLGRYVVRRHLSPDAAGGALRRWMQGNDPVAGLSLLCTVEEPTLEWLPVWYARANTDRGFAVHEVRADEARVPEVRRRLIPPASLERLRDERAELPAPTVPLSALTAKLHGEELRERALVHVPFYRFAYVYRGKRYTAAVDAATGEVRPGLYPKKPELPFKLLTGATLAVYLAAHVASGGGWWLDWGVPRQLLLAYPATLAGSTLLAMVLLALV